jgi:HEPN domain-containing protein
VNGTLQEWIDKAEGDFAVAGRELSVDENPSYDAVCFHAQQCVEKLMKAILIRAEAHTPKSHDLVRLSKLLKNVAQTWSWPDEELHELTLAAVEARYPGSPATHEEARRMFQLCARLRESLLRLANLPT